MAAVKVVPADAVRRVTDIAVKQHKKIVWRTVDIVVRYSLPMNEYYDTIRTIIEDCTDPENGFIFAVFDFAFRANIISMYSNVELPSERVEMFDAVYATDLYDTVCKNANAGQIKSIEAAVLRSALG